MNDARADQRAACQSRLDLVRTSIQEACDRAKRRVEDVEILAVTKGHSAHVIEFARELGLMHVGENRVQDLLAKLDRIPSDMRVQFIGRLQTNKVNKLVGRVESIASVDRPELLDKIAGRAAELEIVQRIWIQVNISDEDQKGGCAPAQVARLWGRAVESSTLEPVGLMGMGSHSANESELREGFSKLRDIGLELREPQRVGLSMGMSGDYAIAIEEGATQVRLGRVLFGSRD